MILPQPLHHVLAPKFPKARLLATADDATAQQTYTFNAMDIGGFGGGQPFSTDDMAALTTGRPLIAATGRKLILGIVHGDDTQSSFNVSSVTIGGVSGTEYIDRGGGTHAVNTAIYAWNDAALAEISNTDVVVTWSESITGCAIGIVEVSNLRAGANVASSNDASTGQLNIAPTTTVEEGMQGGIVVLGTTCLTGGGLERIAWDRVDLSSAAMCHFSPTMLYESFNSAIDFSGAYAVVPNTILQTATVVRTGGYVNWSGDTGSDMVCVYLV